MLYWSKNKWLEIKRYVAGKKMRLLGKRFQKNKINKLLDEKKTIEIKESIN